MFQIVTDGSCDLEQALVEQYQLHVVPFYITKDGLTHQKEKEDISVEEFYQFMVDHIDVFPKTSMPSVQDYMRVFESILENKEDICCNTDT